MANPINPASYIEHSLLDNTATPAQIEKLCAEADRLGFAAVCIYPDQVKRAVEYLYRKTPKVCTVIGFPTGAHASSTKLYEAQLAVEQGASELDLVISIGSLKAGDHNLVHREVAEICQATAVPVKTILEMGLLTQPEQELAAEICLDAGASYLKTHTGWRGVVAIADVELLSAIAKGRVGIKAAGGIRTLAQAQDLITGGATRLGTSRGLEIMAELG
ncbi:MAG: deoxyribose-phosphate aldolase [Pseudanabaenaceae cyanobacterium bins.68]|nr:deoxyribose-phosphate aldolase [Pseudanabaenaceae cyanobacterium bins.68]